MGLILVQEYATCWGATKACVPQLVSPHSRACKPQLLRPACLEPMLHNKRSDHNERSMQCNKEQLLLTATRKSLLSNEDQSPATRHSQREKEKERKKEECKRKLLLRESQLQLSFPGGSDGKESAWNAGDRVWSLGQENSWRRKWQPTPVFLPGKSQDREAWWATVYGVTKSWTRLSD